MGNFTSVLEVVRTAAPAGGDGVYMAMGTAVGPASYDAGGSELDLVAIFKKKVYAAVAYVDNADIRMIFVPATGTAYDSATGLLFVDDNAGTEVTGSIATSCAVTHWVAWGTDA
jgi:hypothetical protein